jgi:hypothetical protein
MKPLVHARVSEAVTDPVPDEFGIADSAAGQTCNFCDEPVRDPAIHWVNGNGDEYYHGACAQKFADRLSADVERLTDAENRPGASAP